MNTISLEHVQNTIAVYYPLMPRETLDAWVELYVRKVMREFQPNMPTHWLEPQCISWQTLAKSCGKFMYAGKMLSVLDEFHRIFPIIMITRRSNESDNYRVMAFIIYPELALLYIHADWLIQTDDPKLLRMRDRMLAVYDPNNVTPAVRMKPHQLRRHLAIYAVND